MINVLNIKKVEQKINSLEKKGNIQKAIEVCQAYLIDNPTIAKMHIRLGDLYMAWHLDINQVKQYIDEAPQELEYGANFLFSPNATTDINKFL